MPPSPVRNALAVWRLVVATRPRESDDRAVEGTTDRLCAVDDRGRCRPGAERLDRVVVGRRAAVVGDQEGARRGRQPGAGVVEVDVERHRVDVAEDRPRALPEDRVGRRDVREGGDEHLVVAADAREPERDVEGDRAVREREGVPASCEVCHLALERGHLAPHRQPAVLEQRDHRRDLLGTEIWSGPRYAYLRHRPEDYWNGRARLIAVYVDTGALRELPGEEQQALDAVVQAALTGCRAVQRPESADVLALFRSSDPGRSSGPERSSRSPAWSARSTPTSTPPTWPGPGPASGSWRSSPPLRRSRCRARSHGAT